MSNINNTNNSTQKQPSQTPGLDNDRKDKQSQDREHMSEIGRKSDPRNLKQQPDQDQNVRDRDINGSTQQQQQPQRDRVSGDERSRAV